MASAGIHPPKYRLPAQTRMGRVRLAVSDLQQSRDFYTGVIGLTVISANADQDPSLTQLGVQGSDEILLELQSLPTAHAIGHQTRLGLYHAAYLLPSREALSSFIQHLNAQGVPFGASDHLYSQSVYLTDPDGFSVEVYADRPRGEWKFEGEELLTGVFRFTCPSCQRSLQEAGTGLRRAPRWAISISSSAIWKRRKLSTTTAWDSI